MKSNRELILDFIKKYSNSVTGETVEGVSTQYLSNKLGMQRTNVSRVLNQLVLENEIEKINGRPVLYRIKNSATSDREYSCFKNLIGNYGSLKNGVKLAKAAILYPTQSLHSLILGKSGSGKSYFANLMHQFAIENNIINEKAPFIKFSCKNYVNDLAKMDHELFLKDNSIVEQANGGVLFINNIELLTVKSRNYLFDLMETGSFGEKSDSLKSKIIIICAMNDSNKNDTLETYMNKFTVHINIPTLKDRPLEERLELIQHFFAVESMHIGKVIEINSEVLRCLLLYECDFNIKQLRKDIQIGCANAYVREFNSSEKKTLKLYLSDFQHYIRKGYLNYKNNREEVENLIPQNYSYSYSVENVERIEVTEPSYEDSQTVYSVIDRKAEELRKRGIPDEDINVIVSVDIENEFKQYTKRLSNKIDNREQLAKIVDSKIISLVSNFLDEAGNLFDRVYSTSVFYGLCLHLGAALQREAFTQRLSNTQITDIIERYKKEYTFCVNFATKLESVYNIRLPIDEVIFITMFVCEKSVIDSTDNKPVVLVAMHGNNTASSIAEVINTLVKGNNTYSYDLSLDKNPQTAYEEMKELITNIHRGKGIIFIYDMGSLKTIVEMISNELNIKIKMIEMPVTLLGLDCSRKAMMETNIDTIYDNVIDSYKKTAWLNNEIYYRNKSSNVIITLCMSGEGGAVQLKSYIENNISNKNVEIISLAISDRSYLLKEVNEIRKDKNILCLVGTYDPQLYGIPFVSIKQIFETKSLNFEKLLKIEPENVLNNDIYEGIYEYLNEQLTHIDVSRLKDIMPFVMNDIISNIKDISNEQELGLFVHIACSVNRLVSKEDMYENIHTIEIIRKYKDLFKIINKALSKLEKEFNIIFTDSEVANIISIIKKL